MSDVRPFKGWRFVRESGPRIAPPYDVISASDRENLASEPENVVHLTLPPGEQGQRDYAQAARTLEAWKKDGVLSQDTEPRVYVLEETTTDGRIRRGFLAALRLASYDERVVLPHERTMRGPKQDRLLLTREVSANLEPLFFLYEDRDGQLNRHLEHDANDAPLTACVGPDGTKLRLFSIDDATILAQVQAYLADRPVIIADGHHRYETMLAYRDECRQKAGQTAASDHETEFVMAYIVNAFDPGSEVRAIHRVIHGDWAALDSAAAVAGFQKDVLAAESAEALIERLASLIKDQHAFVFVKPGGRLELLTRSRGDALDVVVLHEELLSAWGGELSFDSRPARLLETVQSGKAEGGILMNPIATEDLFRVVQAGQVLPQKSTFFSPKIPSGLVIRDL